MVKKAVERTEDEASPEPEKPQKEESLELSNIQLQNLVKQEREDKNYYKNLLNSFIEYLDAEQTQINNNKQIFKQALANSPSGRTAVNNQSTVGTDKVQGSSKDNKKNKKSK